MGSIQDYIASQNQSRQRPTESRFTPTFLSGFRWGQNCGKVRYQFKRKAAV
jgi:hypothetical protein